LLSGNANEQLAPICRYGMPV